MAQRRYGPVQGAGTAVVERESEKVIQLAPTGVTGYAGILERGPTNDLIECVSKADAASKVGSYIPESLVPDAISDFWQLGQGSGRLYLVRVTDGTEKASKQVYFSRHRGTHFFSGAVASAGWDEVKRAMVRVNAHNGGSWGSKHRTIVGDVAVIATDITATTLATGITTDNDGAAIQADEWTGGILILKGVTTKTYIITDHSALGVVTVESGNTMSADLAAGGAPAEAGFSILVPVNYTKESIPKRKAVGAVFKDGEINSADEFGLEVYVNGALSRAYTDLSMDSTASRYASNLINNDLSNYDVALDVLYSGVLSTKMRPVDWYGQLYAGSTTTFTVPVAFVASVTSPTAANGIFRSVTFHASAKPMRHRLRLTILAGALTFSVATVGEYGAGVMRNFPVGTIGTAYAADNPYTIGFTLTNGTTVWAVGDVIDVDVIPLPVDEDGVGLLKGGHFSPNTSSTTKYRVASNTYNTVTLDSAPTAGSYAVNATASMTSSGDLTFPVTVVLGASDSFVIRHGNPAQPTEVTGTVAAAAYANITTLVAALNAGWTAGGGAGTPWSASGTLRAKFTDPDPDVGGYDSHVSPRTSANNVYTLVGLNGLLNTNTFGTLGSACVIQAPLELAGGYDGISGITDSHYMAAMDVTNSYFNRIFGRNQGLVKLAYPGITATNVQKRGLEYAEARNYQFRAEVPSATTDEATAVSYINNTIGRSDYGVVTFPSYGYVVDPEQGDRLKLVSLTGAIHGREARMAKDYAGYHKAAAGIDVILANVVKLPSGVEGKILNEETLNPQGIGIVKKYKGNFILWGDRTISLDPGWKWKHQREQMSYYENILREEFDFIIFAINDPITWQLLLTSLRAMFLPEWTKRALRGATFDDAAQFKIDSSNNTNLTMASGDLNAEISLRLADTVERFVIAIGKMGVFDAVA